MQIKINSLREEARECEQEVLDVRLVQFLGFRRASNASLLHTGDVSDVSGFNCV